jgi:hypothetical protein
MIVPGGTLRRLDGRGGATLPQNFSAEHSLCGSRRIGIPKIGIAKYCFKFKIILDFFKRIVSQRKAGGMTGA